MTISTRAIAVHGLGFAVALVAVQGIAPYAADQGYAPSPDRVVCVRAVSRVAAIEDAARNTVVCAESRMLAVDAESREFMVCHESRILAIDTESRITNVGPETRTTAA